MAGQKGRPGRVRAGEHDQQAAAQVCLLKSYAGDYTVLRDFVIVCWLSSLPQWYPEKKST